jgi:hypothetical protein
MSNIPAAQYLRVSTERQEYSLDCQERTPPVGSNRSAGGRPRTSNRPLCGA